MSTTKHDPKEFLNAFSAKVSAYLMTLPKNQIYEEVNELETEKLSRLMKQSEINENFEICSAIQKVINERMKDIFEKKEV